MTDEKSWATAQANKRQILTVELTTTSTDLQNQVDDYACMRREIIFSFSLIFSHFCFFFFFSLFLSLKLAECNRMGFYLKSWCILTSDYFMTAMCVYESSHNSFYKSQNVASPVLWTVQFSCLLFVVDYIWSTIKFNNRTFFFL